VSYCVIVNSPSYEVNLLRSCGTVVVSGGDPTDQWVVLIEVR
jgi:pyruvate-formate lyase-activating enzyme